MDNCRNIKFGGQANYKIKIQGRIDITWSDTLGGLTIEMEKISEKQYISTLTGVIRDQAALSGILNTIYEMHLPVISVKCIGTNNSE